ncbi:MAG: TetR family transcriptional regulator [Muribaculaceae bacterium]|nr:TetR family transcriptional regulator [Muribaculaceae bacterium]
MVLKTRDRLIEVARQLFARKGVENTTMNDIASASHKGRRTIYTYFKNKRDIFNAVIEQETAKLLIELEQIARQHNPPAEKIETFIRVRFETMREIVSRNGSLRAGFFRDVRKVDRARKLINRREMEILSEILREGVDQGAFSIDNVPQTASVIIHAIHGLDVPYIRDNLLDQGLDKDMVIKRMTALLLDGLRVRQFTH